MPTEATRPADRAGRRGLMATVWAGKDIVAGARKLSQAQRRMAANATEDRTHWHHVTLAELLDELANEVERLKKP